MKDPSEDRCIPLQLQGLFARLQLGQQSVVDTVKLTKSFGWQGHEAFEQQDVQELLRVLFDALEVAFRINKSANPVHPLYEVLCSWFFLRACMLPMCIYATNRAY